jgi:hypothetical protein
MDLDTHNWLVNTLMTKAVSWYQSWLKVIPVLGTLRIDNADTKTPRLCNGVIIPDQYRLVGLPITDYVIFLVSKSDAKSSTVASGLYCALDMNDMMRPIAGTLTFTEEKVSTEIENWEYMFTTTIHEMAHMLGFSADLF